MKQKVIDKILISVIAKGEYTEDQKDVFKYGLECLWTLVTKTSVILIISVILGIVKETLLLMAFYTPLRIYGFGFHANSSLQCWVVSSITYLVLPYILKATEISYPIILLIIGISLVLNLIFAPADTKKRPLINKKMKLKNKIIVLSLIAIQAFIAIYFKNNYLNKFIFGALLIQDICITPPIYYLFKQPYNNYKSYIKENNLSV